MIFNKSNNGSTELRSLTGNYYNSNDFGKMTGHILLATAELKKIIGSVVYNLAEAAYKSTETVVANIDLVPYVQLPIAILATFNLYRSNDISHEDSGRKVKIDSTNEKIPWQWQLEADDAIQMDRYYSAVDALVAYLNESTLGAWKDSDYKKATKLLLINSAEKFDRYYPIGGSGRIYILVLPFLKETELKLKREFGADWTRYLAGENLTEKDDEVLEYLLPAIPLLAMSVAVMRLPLGIIPQGVVRNHASKSITMDASDAATKSDIKDMSKWMKDDAEELINLAKISRNGTTEIQLLPVNSVNNKFVRV